MISLTGIYSDLFTTLGQSLGVDESEDGLFMHVQFPSVPNGPIYGTSVNVHCCFIITQICF